MNVRTPLPIDEALPRLLAAIDAQPRVLLAAPPGSGKSTRAPLALLDAPRFAGKRILLLEPRRVAARAIAARLASERGTPLGSEVGYRIRQDSRVSAATRLEVITEGILTRMLHADPELPDVGAILFDEFHERSVHSDLALALALDVQQHLRDDLRIVVMSATLDLPRLETLLQAPPVVTAGGRLFEVSIEWRQRPRAGEPLAPQVAAVLVDVLRRAELAGDLLVFLPGAYEIDTTQRALQARQLGEQVEVVRLLGELSLADQERALAPAAPGMRKIVLATDIAQTSLTLPGVRCVVDVGLARVPRFDPATGMARLDTVRVSRASADQRLGRAGRVGPGHCVRLWSEHEHASLAAHDAPAILHSDLVPVVLDVAAWGQVDTRQLALLDHPSHAQWASAQAVLRDLGALDDAGRITPHGRVLLGAGVHPRLAHMLRRSPHPRSARIAALLGDRDPLQRQRATVGADVDARVQWLAGRDNAAARLRDQARVLLRAMGIAEDSATAPPSSGECIAQAYPDRIARQRDDSPGRYLLAGGRGAVLAADDPLVGTLWLAIAHLDGDGPEARIRLAAALTESEVEALCSERITTARELSFDATNQTVSAVATRRLGAIVLSAQRVAVTPADDIGAALVAALRRAGLSALPWPDSTRTIRERLAFLHAHRPTQWADVSDAALLAGLESWLMPYASGARSFADLAAADLASALLDYAATAIARPRDTLDRLAPSHIEVPSGSYIAIDYADPAAPVLAVRIQEVFGLRATPTLLDGAVPLTLHLLSPAQRPMQVTRDLASFWANGYADVRKDLRARYPRHPWPDDPLTAPATRRAKPRGT